MLTIQQVRQLLDDEESKELTDEQVTSLLADCYGLAGIIVEDYFEKLKKKSD